MKNKTRNKIPEWRLIKDELEKVLTNEREWDNILSKRVLDYIDYQYEHNVRALRGEAEEASRVFNGPDRYLPHEAQEIQLLTYKILSDLKKS